MTKKLPPIYIIEAIPGGDTYYHAFNSILCHKHTRYQELLIVESDTLGRSLILDRLRQSSEVDEFVYHESLVQPAAFLHGNPEEVLVLGGGEGATLREVLKWNSVRCATMVDIDEEVVNECRTHLPTMHNDSFSDARVDLRFCEARQFLGKSVGKWDLIVADLTDPLPEGPAADFYSEKTFRLLRRGLRRDGIVVIQAGPLCPIPTLVARHLAVKHAICRWFPYTISYAVPVGTLPLAWGFILGSVKELPPLPGASDIDGYLQRHTSGEFRYFDGTSLPGILNEPRYLRNATHPTR